jgi:cobalt/nickel transport system permease protein
MHIPDNYLSPSTCAVMGAAMAPVWAVAVRKVGAEASRTRLPLLGIGAAFSFLVMMLNVPLPGGTTGHAVGGTLIAAILGPWSACISVSVALLVQALLFGDGGILAFGANAFTMAFVLPFLGYFVFRLIARLVPGPRGEIAGLAIGSYLGLCVAALVASVLFGIQPLLFRDASGLPLYCPYPPSVAIPAMLVPHVAVAGVVEAVFAVAVYSYVRRVSPGAVRQGETMRIGPIYLLVVLLAAGTAWGEWGTEEIAAVVSGGKALGFVPQGMTQGFAFQAPLGDYSVGGSPEILGYVISAVAGAAILIILFKLLSLLVRGTRPAGP